MVVGNIALNTEPTEKASVKISGWSIGIGGESHGIWAHEAKPPRLGADMPTVHVEVELLLITSLRVYITHEWATGRCLISIARHDHPDAYITASDAVDNIVNESVTRVELASCLPVGAFESI